MTRPHAMARGLFATATVLFFACAEPPVQGSLPDAGSLGGDTPDAGSTLPEVTITAPADGAQAVAGTALTFQGSAKDHAGAAIASSGLAWTSDKDGQLGLGAEIHSALVTPGSHLITLTATDTSGQVGTRSIHLTVTAAAGPVVVIKEPNDGKEAAIGELVRFRCEATPAVANGKIIWTSSIDGQIGIGSDVRTGLATAGDHTITCTATDEAGNKGQASITLHVVANRAPKVSIKTPADGAYFKPDQSITFTGTAQDPEDGALTGAALTWKSSLSGQLGLGAQVATAMPLGDHVVTLSAKDTQGAVGEASITVHVVSNVPPQCTISEPRDGRTVLVGQSVRFSGTCVDPDGGTVTGLKWTSSLDGQLGLGATIQTAVPTAGEHRVKLCAPDPVDANLVGCAEIGLSVKANTAPTCSVTAPSANAVVAIGEAVRLEATVQDAEDPSVTGQQPSGAWTDDRQGQLLNRASGSYAYAAGMGGTHVLTFTGTDTGGLTCTETRTIRVNTPPQVAITATTQNGSNSTPFHTGSAITLTGTATDADGDALTTAWTDGIEGSLGSAMTATLAAPLVGRHRVTFSATDPYGAAASTNTTFDVLPPNSSKLVDALSTANTTLSATGTRQVLSVSVASNGQAYVGNANAALFKLSSADPAGVLTRVTGSNLPPDDVNQILIDEAAGLIYLATKDGLQVCGFNATTGVNAATCHTYRDGDLPGQNNNLQAIAKVTGSNGQQYLLIGNGDGLLVTTQASGSVNGQRYLQNRDIRAMAADGNVVWIATDGDGLYRFDPANPGNPQQWRTDQGAPCNQMRAVAVGTGGAAIWIGCSGNGLGRYEPATSTWSSWRAGGQPSPGLVNDNVRSLAIARVTIAGTARDVVWVGTENGVSRLDPTMPSFMSLTTNDGLPGQRVNSIAVLPDGAKLFGTDQGLARYVGP